MQVKGHCNRTSYILLLPFKLFTLHFNEKIYLNRDLAHWDGLSRLRSWHWVQVQFAGRLLQSNTSLKKPAGLACFRLGSKSWPSSPLFIVQHRWWGVERQYRHIVQKVGVASDTTYHRLFEEHANACVMWFDKRWVIPQSFKIVSVSVRVSAAHTFGNHFADLL